jgi:hypothetical protein
VTKKKSPAKMAAREIQKATGVPYGQARRIALEQLQPRGIEAVQWTGENEAELTAFAGPGNFGVLDDEDRANCGDPEATAEVLDSRHSTWELLYVGDWVVRDGGGLRRCSAEEFSERYEAAGS